MNYYNKILYICKLMKKQQIKDEILKENPDYNLISKLSKELYIEQLPTNIIGFKKIAFNVIKANVQNLGSIKQELSCVFTTDKYEYVLVGGWIGINVNKFKKMIIDLTKLDKYIIIITDSTLVNNNLIKVGIETNLYNSNIEVRFNRLEDKRTKFFTIKNDEFKIKVECGTLKQKLRELKLKSI